MLKTEIHGQDLLKVIDAPTQFQNEEVRRLFEILQEYPNGIPHAVFLFFGKHKRIREYIKLWKGKGYIEIIPQNPQRFSCIDDSPNAAEIDRRHLKGRIRNSCLLKATRKKNPHREETKAWRSYNLLLGSKEGLTFQEYKRLGGILGYPNHWRKKRKIKVLEGE